MPLTADTRLYKGALLQMDALDVWRKVVLFQYNPQQVTRTVSASSAEGVEDQQRSPRLLAPPEETIQMEVELDATEQLNAIEGVPGQSHLHGMLAALELLLYPTSSWITAREVLARSGVIEIVAPEAPLTLLIWGSPRVLPVRITSYTIIEERFDPNLNPIQATVNISMNVLNYHHQGLLSPAGGAFMVHQISKEILASFQSTESMGQIDQTLR